MIFSVPRDSYTHTNTQTHKCTNKQTHIYIYIYMHTHNTLTHTHIHTHTHTPDKGCALIRELYGGQTGDVVVHLVACLDKKISHYTAPKVLQNKKRWETSE